MASAVVPSAAPFTQQQREDLERLWKVQTTRETQDAAGSVPDDTIKPIQSDCIRYMARLHAFFLAFLKKHSNDDDTNTNSSSSSSSSRTGVAGNEDDEERVDDFLKDGLRTSCLEPFYLRYVEKHKHARRNERQGGNGSQRQRQQQQRHQHQQRHQRQRILPSGGRAEIVLHHEEFLSELNDYEFRGRFRSDSSTCIIHCFGSYLHHRPLEALPAMNVAMALAVATSWRLCENAVVVSATARGVPTAATTANDAYANANANTNANANASKAMDRFLDSCRINVRFVHVSPLIPMADIKTGLVKKFIAVKGHVVKARPRRLRVSTAEL